MSGSRCFRGGIRGVVELAILSTIEKEIGFGIPIQEMFDLVVGTSTGNKLPFVTHVNGRLGADDGEGGIVALGVFERRWTLTEAKRRFQSLARQAFSLRRALSVPVLSAMIQPFCDYKYKTSGIEEALKESFGEEFMFGQLRDRPEDAVGDQVKVGVVTCIEGRYQPCLIANYSRNPVASSEEGALLPPMTPSYSQHADPIYRRLPPERRPTVQGLSNLASVSAAIHIYCFLRY